MSFKSFRQILLSRQAVLAGAALVVLAMAESITGASAADMDAVEHVHIGQFNLNSDAGSRAAFDSLASASRRVCRVGESRQLSDAARAQACYREALARAVQSVRNERLTQLYRVKEKVG